MIYNDHTFVASISGSGYQLLTIFENEIIDTEPVIAFFVYSCPTLDNKKFFNVIFPVTSSGVQDYDCQEFALLRPDGKVEVPEAETFDNLGFFQSHLKKEKAAKAAVSA